MTPSALAGHLHATAQALDVGDVARAASELAAAVAIAPDNAETWRLRAILHDQRGERDAAFDAIRHALAQRPNDALCHNTLGTALGNAGAFAAAIGALERACALEPRLAMAWYNLGVMHAKCVDYRQAEAAFRQALAIDPEHTAARVWLGDILRNCGQPAAAATAYRTVLAHEPTCGAAWRGLADLRHHALGPADIAAMRTALTQTGIRIDDRIAIGHALAHALDDAGALAASLAALADAKALSRGQQRWNAAAFTQTVSDLLAAFTPPVAGAPVATLGHEVIFIVGLPRSGTTLVEQILAAHPKVTGAGELPDLKAVLREESSRRQVAFPQWVRAATPADWERLGRHYLERTTRWRTQRPVSTDKLPNNWMFIGAIRAMLPGAHLIACRREPLESCFACYRQYRNHHDYSDDFADLAAFWRDYDRSIRHWRAVSPASLYEHSHAALLAAPEARMRDLLAACGLSWDAQCLRFHETLRDVHTPSASQVREPLRQQPTYAQRYGALLDPLRAALGMPPA